MCVCLCFEGGGGELGLRDLWFLLGVLDRSSGCRLFMGFGASGLGKKHQL